MLASETRQGILVQSIPPSMTTLDQWTLWRYEERGERMTKVPYQAIMSRRIPAKSNDPSTWASFGAALTVYELCRSTRYDGLLFAIAPPVVFVDLDHCRDASTGHIEPWAREIILSLDSYTEISASGEGLHVFARGTLPPRGRRKGDIEMYDSRRFAAITGHSLDLETLR